MFHKGSRTLQDRFDTRRLADRIESRLVQDEIDDESRRYIESVDMFFLATADDQGRPNCSFKGGARGFVRVVDAHTIAFPNYDGNGMYLSMGNVGCNPHVGLLFIDFEHGSRLRLNGVASIDDGDPLISEYPEAQFVVRVSVLQLFPNCPRYVPKMKQVEASPFVPRAGCETPVPEWKRSEWARDALPKDDPSRDPSKPTSVAVVPPPAPQSHQWRAPYRVETARLNLRALGSEHVDQLHEVVPKNKTHLQSTMPWAHAEPLPYDARIALLTQMRSNFDLGVDFVLGIFERSSNRYIGGTGLHPRVGPHTLEIGYWLAADAQGKGLVTEAVVALASVALETMGARRLEIRCSPGNLKSRAIPERLGFQLDGVLRDGGLSGSGELEDKMVWSLLAKEYPERPLFTAPRPTLFDVLDRPIEP